jgi:hypothetical protein
VRRESLGVVHRSRAIFWRPNRALTVRFASHIFTRLTPQGHPSASGAHVLATERAGPALDVLARHLAANEATTSGRVQACALDWAHRGGVQELLSRLRIVPRIVTASGTCKPHSTSLRSCVLA